MTSGCAARNPASRAYRDKRTASAAGAHLFARVSTATACLGAPGPATRWRACMVSTPRSFSKPRRSTSSARSTRSALRRSSRSRCSLDHEAASVALWTGHSAGAVQGSRRRFASQISAVVSERGRLACGFDIAEIIAGRCSDAGTRRGRTPRCRPISETELRRGPEPLRRRGYVQWSFTDIFRSSAAASFDPTPSSTRKTG